MKVSSRIKNQLSTLPKSPGCYIYRDDKKKIIYIGKAVNLFNRVKSYFNNYSRLDPKIALMVDQISDIQILKTDNELEALILETNLIKKHKPKYNRMMKDDKNYSWLMITKNEDFPRIEFVREKKLKTADYFGPYTDRRPIKTALKQLRLLFPYRTCQRKIAYIVDKNNLPKFYSSDKKPCLYYHMNLCSAPCAEFTTRSAYRKNINNIKRFLRSRKYEIIESLAKEMKLHASMKKFEQAAEIRDKLDDLRYLAERVKVEKDMDEMSWELKKTQDRSAALERFVKKLSIPNLVVHSNFKIECYDISNIQGKNATGSMVVFINGKPSKSNYRKFKIHLKDEPDDFGMLQEVLTRRFSHSTKEKKDRSFDNYPDLMIIDGGKGQLSSVLEILEKVEINVPTVGLAKREEEIFKSVDDEFKKIKLLKGTSEYFLIQRIRDEAHRFAIKYHRKLRSNQQIKSVLDDIPGVGELVKRRLLQAFGSYDGIKKASVKELQSVVKNRRTVENIKKVLKIV